jgi:putative ABC transport system substrate-binding protein
LRSEYRWAEDDSARLPERVSELIRLKSDVIVTRGALYVQSVKDQTSTIPIVFVVHADPVGTGHVESLAHPGGNITGLALLQNVLGPKSLQLLSSAAPSARRIAALYHPDTPTHLPGLKALEEPARSLGLQLQVVAARTAAELESAFVTMVREAAQALLVLSSPLFVNERLRLAQLALSHKLPTMFGPREHVEAGGLMSYGANFTDLWRRAATYVDKILKGAHAAELPVEQAERFDLAINLKTAQALSLTIPDSLLQQATEIAQ